MPSDITTLNQTAHAVAPRLDLRAQGDVDLEAKLFADPHVKRLVDDAEKRKDLGIRRSFLASALRVTAPMSPRLATLVGHCTKTLGFEGTLETYVYPDAHFNAGMARPEDGRVFMLFSSSLFEAFDDEELKFVIGHELGHHLFRHHRLPMKTLAESSMVGVAATQLFAWSRYAEISADRAGLTCAGTLDGVTSSLLKLASGLRQGLTTMRAEDLLSQFGDMQAELDKRTGDDASRKPQPDWFATHPFSPLRLQAVNAFSRAEQFAGQGLSRIQLETEVSELMAVMEPTYLEDTGEIPEAMRRLLLAGGVAVATANGEFDEQERKVLERFFGPGSLDRLNAKALTDDLPRRISNAVEVVPVLRRGQVVRDLCLVARADGHVSAEERALLLQLATGLGVEVTLVDRALGAELSLD